MLDLFTIFTKGGIVLWYIQNTAKNFAEPVNALIKGNILQGRGGNNFTHEALSLRYKFDNEFELVFVVAYQKILQLAYADKLLEDIQLEFRDKYKNELDLLKCGKFSGVFEFRKEFERILNDVELKSRQSANQPKVMKSFLESEKSKKTVKSMIENPKEEVTKNDKKKKGKTPNATKEPDVKDKKSTEENGHVINDGEQLSDSTNITANGSPNGAVNDFLDEETIQRNRLKLMNRMNKKPQEKSPKPTVVKESKKKTKAPTVWGLEGKTKDLENLDFNKEMNSVEIDDSKLVGTEENNLTSLIQPICEIPVNHEGGGNVNSGPTRASSPGYASTQKNKKQSKKKQTRNIPIRKNPIFKGESPKKEPVPPSNAHNGSNGHPPPPEPIILSPLEQIHQIIDEENKIRNSITNMSCKKDKDYLCKEEMLTRLLLKLDTIDSQGRDEIRNARKNGIKTVQATLDHLELKLLPNDDNSQKTLHSQ